MFKKENPNEKEKDSWMEMYRGLTDGLGGNKQN